MNNLKPNQLKFYADTPQGEKNKLFSWYVKNFGHAIDLAAYFIEKYNFNIRAAWYTNDKGINTRIDKLINPQTGEIIKEKVNFSELKNTNIQRNK